MSARHLTPTQWAILARAARDPDGARLKGAGKQRAGAHLERAGLGRFATSVFVNARFHINDAGRATLHDRIVHAETEASRYLGNSNEAREAGQTAKAERLLAKCQRWHDIANELRGDGPRR